MGELSALDMEKYLKKTEVSGSSDTSMGHTTFNLTGWADNLARNQQEDGHQEQASSAQQADADRGEATVNSTSSAAAAPGRKADSRRSSIPRLRSSCPSALRPAASADSTTARHHSSSSTTSAKAAGLSGRTANGLNTVKPSLETSQKTDRGSATSPGLPRAAPGLMKGQSGLASCTGSSPPPPQRVQTSGQDPQDKTPPSRKPVAAATAAGE